LSEANIELDQLRAYLRETGAGALTVDDLRESDLPSIGWSGNPAHLRSVGEKLSAAARGELDYLAVRAPDGTPLAKGAVEYGSRKDGGEIGQLATHPELQGMGLGSHLIAAAEERVRLRGLRWSVVGVEEGNSGAADLYERLGYRTYGREQDSWEVEDSEGNVTVHHAEVVLLRKELQ
jgi:ribosomal protein S18 acetylase RimI-like enzyme